MEVTTVTKPYFNHILSEMYASEIVMYSSEARGKLMIETFPRSDLSRNSDAAFLLAELCILLG